MFVWRKPLAIAFQLIGTAAIPFGLWHMELSWLILSYIVFCIYMLTITVGMHRLFAHGSFKCHRAWHYVFGYFGTLTMTASTIQWTATHYAHHKNSDTDKDPHETRLGKIIGAAGYATDKFDMTRAKRLLVDPLHQNLHRYYLLVIASWVFAWYLIGGWQGAFAGWVIPTVAVMWMGGHHTRRSHQDGKPINMGYWLSWVYYGEHLHKNHHDKAINPSFAANKGELDIGHLFIKLISYVQPAKQV